MMSMDGGKLSFRHGQNENQRLNDETLDEIFQIQFKYLKGLLFKLANEQINAVCFKWLDVFGRASKEEKQSRNCLSLLMRDQLDSLCIISEPFINLENCNRNLHSVLNGLDKETYNCLSDYLRDITKDYISMQNYYKGTNAANANQLRTAIFENEERECQENKFLAENMMLRRETENFRLELLEYQMQYFALLKTEEECGEEQKADSLIEPIWIEEISWMKKHFLEKINAFLERLVRLRQYNFAIKFDIFKATFADLISHDSKLLEPMQVFDTEFERLLSRYFEKELNMRKMIITQHMKEKQKNAETKLRAKYRKRLKDHFWCNALQIKLVNLKLFLELKRMFIELRQGKEKNMWQVIKIMEENFERTVRELI